MINSVSVTSQLAQVQQNQQHHQKTVQEQQKKPEPQDTVVLSKQATGARDVDQHGDKH